MPFHGGLRYNLGKASEVRYSAHFLVNCFHQIRCLKKKVIYREEQRDDDEVELHHDMPATGVHPVSSPYESVHEQVMPP